MVPAPSFEDKNIERGFNHVEVIFSSLKMPIEKCFIKTEDIKQADLSSEERKNVGNYLKIVNGKKLSGKKILIVDDVYTTGSTVKAMIEMIKAYNPKEIKVLVMSKTINHMERIK